MSQVSVVIPARDALPLLRDQLEALLVQKYAGSWEVVVADNGSSDGTAEFVRSLAGGPVPVRVVDAGRKAGANVARNEGCRAAEGDKILFLDADDIVQPGWVAALADGLERFDMVGGVIVPFVSDGVEEGPRGLHDSLGFLPSPVGANAGIRREVFEAGGFDEELSGGGDETAFFWTAQLAGYSLGLVENAIVRYRLREELDDLVAQRRSYGRGHVRLYRRFKAHGMPRSSTWQALKDWVWIAIRTGPEVCSRSPSDEWRLRRARRAGRLRESVRSRTLYL